MSSPSNHSTSQSATTRADPKPLMTSPSDSTTTADWHNETASALFTSPTDESPDPTKHILGSQEANDKHSNTYGGSGSDGDGMRNPSNAIQRRASCPYDGTCTHTLTSDKAPTSACGKVQRHDSGGAVDMQPHPYKQHHYSRSYNASHPAANAVQETVAQGRQTRRDSYEDFKRGCFRGWLGDGEEEKCQPWGFSSTHASRNASPTPL
ncbi:hypothetical protein AAFC00_006722 [Neodothiora populina]|uniref:Uncharacterized protein n=1 Tax=Neodothiora populina TaxID=2781224 RepID=A0ABR3PBC0_9PEZI